MAYVVNGRGVTQHQYSYAVNPSDSGSVTTTVMDPLGTTIQVDHYSGGYWTKKILYVAGTPVTETFFRDNSGAVTLETDGNNHGTTVVYSNDGKWNVTSITDAEGKNWSYTYNANSRVTSSTDANLKNRTYVYDSSTGNLTQIQEPGGRTTYFTYYSSDPLKGLVQTVNVNGQRQVSFSYDGNGNLHSVNYPSPGGTTYYDYDSRSRPVTVTDAMGPVTKLTWQSTADVLQKIGYADTNSVSFSYDSNLNLSLYQDENQNTTLYICDPDDNPATIVYPGSVTILNKYDALNRPTTFIDPVNPPTIFTYNEQDLVSSVSDGLGTVSYTYDEALNRKTKSERGITTTYDYYNNNRLKKISFNDGTTAPVSFGYDGNGNRTSILDAVDPSTPKSIDYDDLNRPTIVRYPSQGVTFTYGYNAFNDRTSMQLNKISGTYSYTYKDNYLLESVTDPGGTSGFLFLQST